MVVILFTSPTMLLAIDYVTCNSGNYDTPVASSTIRFSTDGGATCTITPSSITWVSGDVLEVKAGTTLTVEANWAISVDITVNVKGNIVFDNGKMDLTAGSTLNMYPGSTIACVGGCGNNDQIRIGTAQYSGTELNDINNAPRPTTINSGGSILPVTLLFFKALPHDDVIQLLWATATEKNFDRFVIEKTLDGKDFFEVGTLKGAGTTSTRQDYKFDDLLPVSGRSYYRLKSIDFDGYTEYFDLVRVDFAAAKRVVVSPNPTIGSEINILMNFASETNTQILVVDVFGKEYLRRDLTNAYGKTALPTELTPGTYILKAKSGKDEFITRFIVSK